MRTQSALRLRAHNNRLTYVGGTTGTFRAATLNVSLTSLTGGVASSPRAGDLVIVAMGSGNTSAVTYTVSTAGYTNLPSLYANDTNDSNLAVAYKYLSTDETSVDISSSVSTAYSTVTIHVWRGSDPFYPVLLPVTSASSTNTRLVNPAAASPPAYYRSQVIVVGNGSAASAFTYTASELSNFIQVTQSTNISTTAMGSYEWTSGTYDPAAWTSSITDTVNDAYTSYTLVVNPRTPRYGKIKPIGSTTAATSGSTTSLAINTPTGVVNGDLLIMVVVGGFSGSNDYTITGWTQLYDRGSSGGFSVFHKTASNEGSTITINATNSNSHSALCVAYRNAAVDVFGTVNITSATGMTATAITVTENYSVLLTIGSVRSADSTASFSQTSYSAEYGNQVNQTEKIYEERVHSGSTGTRTITFGNSSNNTIVLMSLKQA